MTRPRPEAGTSVTHRRYVSYSHAHYAGELVDGAYGLGLFGDVATDLCITTDGDEGLFASYSDVQFLAPVRTGDVVEARATLVKVGNRSRSMEFELTVVARQQVEAGASSAALLDPPVVATTAVGVVVVPPTDRTAPV
jgi:3-aminobutyryl-CoA ammonia-lyase